MRSLRVSRMDILQTRLYIKKVTWYGHERRENSDSDWVGRIRDWSSSRKEEERDIGDPAYSSKLKDGIFRMESRETR